MITERDVRCVIDELTAERNEWRSLAQRLAAFVRAWDRCDEGIFEVRAAITDADLACAAEAMPPDDDGGS